MVAISLHNSDSTVLVDDLDADLASKGWYAKSGGYARLTNPKSIEDSFDHLLMHRTILQRKVGRILKREEFTDHINGNPADNRRCNLRVASHTENMRNRRLPSHNSSGYMGVEVISDMKTSPYRVRLYVNRIKYHVGYFADIDEAAWMRDQWAIGLYGEFARLNFEYFEVQS